ncbi:MAG: long-chain-fatty-acid--CoA ligase [Bryobacteraceae bacterium]|nr:long-chain-fatty-acid--CoA ligase [Bryobacteraceae bacterium]
MDTPHPLTPVRILGRAIDLFGPQTAVVCAERKFDYSEFGQRCCRLSEGLLRSGVQPGDRVAFLSWNNHQLVEAYYGVPMARAILTPLNVRLAPSELEVILRQAAPRFLFYEAEFASVAAGVADCRCICLETEYEEFLASEAAFPELAGLDENSPAELFYTSGTTGSPRGVLLSHRALYLHAFAVAMTYLDQAARVDLHTIPMFHANAWGHVHADVLCGATQVMNRRFVPAEVLRLIELHSVTYMGLVPTMARALLQAPELASSKVSSLRDIEIGGAACSPQLIQQMEQAFGCPVWSGYGLTEAGPMLTYSKPESSRSFVSDEERWMSQAMAGRPIPGVELRVIDDAGVAVPQDGKSMGEIVVRSGHLMTGYYCDPDGTAVAMRSGWLHTGDIAMWHADGSVEIVDRLKEIIISGGENISSLEIERMISAHPDVRECAVVAAPDETWGEVPTAVIVLREGSALTSGDILAFLDGKLGTLKMPKMIHFDTAPLPRTGTGKVRKMELRERFWTGKARRIGE